MDIPTETFYMWKEFKYVEGFEEEGKRLLTPWADPMVHEHPMDLQFKTPTDAQETKDSDAPDEDWVLAKVTMEVVDHKTVKVEIREYEGVGTVNAHLVFTNMRELRKSVNKLVDESGFSRVVIDLKPSWKVTPEEQKELDRI